MITSKAMSMDETREEAWARLLEKGSGQGPGWDLLVIGGGITGAGILREAARRGMAAALIEQCDFAWGTSSRSAKMVHGGLRYLMGGRFKLTRDSVRERERLIREVPGLVDPMGFLLGDYRGQSPSKWSFLALLTVYDLLAWKWNHLEDLLLRRTRLGVLLEEGGTALLGRIREVCEQELGWDHETWVQEATAYQDLWGRCYKVP